MGDAGGRPPCDLAITSLRLCLARHEGTAASFAVSWDDVVTLADLVLAGLCEVALWEGESSQEQRDARVSARLRDQIELATLWALEPDQDVVSDA